LIVTLIRFVLLVLLFNFVMHCIISTVVVAFEINFLSYLIVLKYPGIKQFLFVLKFCRNCQLCTVHSDLIGCTVEI